MYCCNVMPCSNRSLVTTGATAGLRRSWLLELDVLERRRVREARNQTQACLLDARTDPCERTQLVQGRVRHAFVHDVLDLMQERLAFRSIDLASLTLEEILDFRKHAVGVESRPRHERLEA